MYRLTMFHTRNLSGNESDRTDMSDQNLSNKDWTKGYYLFGNVFYFEDRADRLQVEIISLLQDDWELYEEPLPTLKPCPFCGGEADIYVGENSILDATFVKCIGCGSESPWVSEEKEAIEAWNKRVRDLFDKDILSGLKDKEEGRVKEYERGKL